MFVKLSCLCQVVWNSLQEFQRYGIREKITCTRSVTFDHENRVSSSLSPSHDWCQWEAELTLQVGDREKHTSAFLSFCIYFPFHWGITSLCVCACVFVPGCCRDASGSCPGGQRPGVEESSSSERPESPTAETNNTRFHTRSASVPQSKTRSEPGLPSFRTLENKKPRSVLSFTAFHRTCLCTENVRCHVVWWVTKTPFSTFTFHRHMSWWSWLHFLVDILVITNQLQHCSALWETPASTWSNSWLVQTLDQQHNVLWKPFFFF